VIVVDVGGCEWEEVRSALYADLTSRTTSAFTSLDTITTVLMTEMPPHMTLVLVFLQKREAGEGPGMHASSLVPAYRV
jgi:hypothetical protein